MESLSIEKDENQVASTLANGQAETLKELSCTGVMTDHGKDIVLIRQRGIENAAFTESVYM